MAHAAEYIVRKRREEEGGGTAEEGEWRRGERGEEGSLTHLFLSIQFTRLGKPSIYRHLTGAFIPGPLLRGLELANSPHPSPSLCRQPPGAARASTEQRPILPHERTRPKAWRLAACRFVVETPHTPVLRISTPQRFEPSACSRGPSCSPMCSGKWPTQRAPHESLRWSKRTLSACLTHMRGAAGQRRGCGRLHDLNSQEAVVRDPRVWGCLRFNLIISWEPKPRGVPYLHRA
jgi:hypothetical protein